MALRAEITVTPTSGRAPEVFTTTCVLTNAGDRTEAIDLAVLESPSLALELETSTGNPVFFPPPPVPPVEPPMLPLPPGAAHRATLPGFLPSWTEPGHYRVRCRYVAGGGDPVRSDWAAFELER